MSLSSFLAHLPKPIISSSSSSVPLHIVIGNEAADADSIVSSLIYAYLLHNEEHNPSSSSTSSSLDGNTLFLPVIGAPRKDMSLRVDTETLLNKVGIGLQHIKTLDELTLSPSQRLQLSLVDHNCIAPSLASILSKVPYKVVTIIDHHKDMQQYPEVNGAQRNIAFDDVTHKPLVGSTCTLITEMLFEKYSHLISEDICFLLMGVIAIDTMNMDSKTERGTARDQCALDKLTSFLGSSSSSPYSSIQRNALYEELISIKSSTTFWSSLSAYDTLRVDYKTFSTGKNAMEFGMSSILMRLEAVVAKENFQDTVAAYLNDNHLAMLVLMGVTFDPLHRELLVVIRNKKKHYETVLNFLLHSSAAQPLQLEFIRDIHFENGEHIGMMFLQRNSKATRKQVAPLLQQLEL